MVNAFENEIDNLFDTIDGLTNSEDVDERLPLQSMWQQIAQRVPQGDELIPWIDRSLDAALPNMRPPECEQTGIVEGSGYRLSLGGYEASAVIELSVNRVRIGTLDSHVTIMFATNIRTRWCCECDGDDAELHSATSEGIEVASQEWTIEGSIDGTNINREIELPTSSVSLPNEDIVFEFETQCRR